MSNSQDLLNEQTRQQISQNELYEFEDSVNVSKRKKKQFKELERREEIRKQFEQLYLEYGIFDDFNKSENDNNQQHHCIDVTDAIIKKTALNLQISESMHESLPSISPQSSTTIGTQERAGPKSSAHLHSPRIFLGIDGIGTLDYLSSLQSIHTPLVSSKATSDPSAADSAIRGGEIAREQRNGHPTVYSNPPSTAHAPPAFDSRIHPAARGLVAAEAHNIERWDCLDRLEQELRGGAGDVLAADGTGILSYLDACRQAGAAPQRAFLKQAAGAALSMRHFPLGVRGGAAVCRGVAANAGRLVEVDLYGCSVGVSGCRPAAPRRAAGLPR